MEGLKGTVVGLCLGHPLALITCMCIHDMRDIIGIMWWFPFPSPPWYEDISQVTEILQNVLSYLLSMVGEILPRSLSSTWVHHAILKSRKNLNIPNELNAKGFPHGWKNDICWGKWGWGLFWVSGTIKSFLFPLIPTLRNFPVSTMELSWQWCRNGFSLQLHP